MNSKKLLEVEKNLDLMLIDIEYLKECQIKINQEHKENLQKIEKDLNSICDNLYDI